MILRCNLKISTSCKLRTSGLAQQTEFNLPLNPANGFAIPWTSLAAQGKIKITIKDSPNGNYSAYKGISVGGNIPNLVLDDISGLSIANVTGNSLSFVRTTLPLGDEFIDIVIHGSGTDFLVEIEGITYSIKVEELAAFINATFPDQSKAVRLLSCNNLEAAQELRAALDRDVIATNEAIYLTANGEIGTDGAEWFRLSGRKVGNKIEEIRVKEDAAWDKGIPNEDIDYIYLGSRNSPDGSIIGNKVDGVFLSSRDKKVLHKFREGKYYGFTEIEIVRYFREIDGINDVNGIQLFGNANVDGDLVRLKVITDQIGNDANKINTLFSPPGPIISDNASFVRVVDDYINVFKQTPISNVKPAYFNNPNRVFDDVNMQHILDKHTVEHFDLGNIDLTGSGNDIDMFPIGTTQADVANYIDEALNKLNISHGPNYPLNGAALDVTLGDGTSVKIGSNLGSQITLGNFPSNDNIIGQFYPTDGTFRVSYSDLKILKVILE